ncbi:M56 family metallopeptidase [Luteirhabdus pelagi]|uniref:M56 family metallopeptidase n=1 Tax=Luteirhabdus pelagi TaxID=2792783 RepID=UPI0019394ED4|nr:M56 family metallopeptidase [Luteirhabdus pelagi]
MIHYILQTIAFQLLFLLLYEVFLKRETFFQQNRWYLLGTSALSFVLPLVKLPALQSAIPSQYQIQLPAVLLGEPSTTTTSTQLPEVLMQSNTEMIVTVSQIAVSLWIIGMIGSIIWLAYKGLKLHQYIKNNPSENYHNATVKIVPGKHAFSFLHYIFLGTELSISQRGIALQHEYVHIKQRHSWDLLYFEILRTICWFNPLLYLFQQRITSVHEYLADSAITKNISKTSYCNELLASVFQTSAISFTNTFFNHSSTRLNVLNKSFVFQNGQVKKRILMLHSKQSTTTKLWKYLLVLPLLAGMLVYTSCSQEVENATDENLSQQISNLKMSLENKESLSQEEMAQFKALFSKATQLSGDSNIKVEYTDDNWDESDSPVPFTVIERVPVFPGCEGMENEAAKKCMSQKIASLVAENFNTDVSKDSDINGKQRIFVQFKIDAQGNVVDTKARAPHPELEKEALRVIEMLPQMTPGEHRGKQVAVIYSLPIIFEI